MGKHGFFRVLNFGFFYCQKVNFQKFQAHFFKIVIESGNFDNTVLIEHIKTCFKFFGNFNIQGQKVNFRKFQGQFFKGGRADAMSYKLSPEKMRNYHIRGI